MRIKEENVFPDTLLRDVKPGDVFCIIHPSTRNRQYYLKVDHDKASETRAVGLLTGVDMVFSNDWRVHTVEAELVVTK